MLGWKDFIKMSATYTPTIALNPFQKGHPGYDPDSVNIDGFQLDENGNRIGDKPAWEYGHANYNPNAKYPDGHYRDGAGRVIPQIGALRGKLQDQDKIANKARALLSELRSGRGGTGDPDSMLGDRINPLIIAAPMATVGAAALPSSGANFVGSQAREISTMSGLGLLAQKSKKAAKMVDLIRNMIPILKTHGR